MAISYEKQLKVALGDLELLKRTDPFLNETIELVKKLVIKELNSIKHTK